MPDLCVIEGDGIGREVIPAAVRVLKAVVPELSIIPAEAGWECFQKRGVSVPAETLETARSCGAALFGAVSSPTRRVEGYRSAILTLRQELNLYANLRPVRSLPRISARPNVDLLVVRENTEGLYVGQERLEPDVAIAARVITRDASRRIGLCALDLARASGMKHLTIVHKANVLPLTDGLFRDTIREAYQEQETDHSEITVDEMLVDNAAFQLADRPEQFGVIVTTNLFGDILSDVAAVWCGGLGMAPSLNIGETVMLAEPVHGSAPDIAGRGIANPLAAILSAALLIRHAWNRTAEADLIETAVRRALDTRLDVVDGRLASGISTAMIERAVIDCLGQSQPAQPLEKL